jgi:putative aldouronate transport system permease protein
MAQVTKSATAQRKRSRPPVRLVTRAPKNKPGRLATLRRYRVPLLMIVPGILFYCVYYYLPIFGNVIAFQDYLPFVGIQKSAFNGLDNFRTLFASSEFWYSLINTLEITALQLVFFFPAPIILALLLNSLLSNGLRRVIQSIIYIPHFMSWVVVVILFQQIFGGAGLIPQALRTHGVANPIDVMTNPAFFKPLVTAQVIWKDTGWGTIIFFAAITSIDVALYESAAMDGANGFQRMWHVTLPGIIPITVLLLILRIGTILSVGFEQILLQEPAVGAKAGQVLDTYVYFHGIVDGNWGVGAAAGLIKGVVGLALVMLSNRIAHRLGQGGLYS